MVTSKDGFFDVIAISLDKISFDDVEILSSLRSKLSDVTTRFICICSAELETTALIQDGWEIAYPQDHQSPLSLAIERSSELVGRTGCLIFIEGAIDLPPANVFELKRILSKAEKHGIVGVRHNLTGQGHFYSNASDIDVEVPMPEYNIVRSTASPVLVIKAPVIDLVRRLHSGVSLDKNSLSDTANTVGFSTVQANEIFVSVIKKPNMLSALKPEIEAASGADWFAGHLIEKSTEKMSIFIDIFDLDPIWNGTSRNAISFLRKISEIQRVRPNLPEILIGTSEVTSSFFKLDELGLQLIDLECANSRTFDLGFSLVPLTRPSQLIRLNKLCIRWQISHLDVIALRSKILSDSDPGLEVCVRDSLRFADAVVTISEFSKDDLLAFFPHLAKELRGKISVIPEGADTELLDLKPESRRSASKHFRDFSSGYVLVIGNSYPHKQMLAAVSALKDFEAKVVAFGLDRVDYKNVIAIPGGNLSSFEISELYRNASVIVYPSAYEGFGLPIADAALFNKPVALFDTEVAHEITALLGSKERTKFFSNFNELGSIIQELMAMTVRANSNPIRSLSEFNSELFEHTLRTLKIAVEPSALNMRFDHVNSLDSYTRSTRLSNQHGKQKILAKILRKLNLI